MTKALFLYFLIFSAHAEVITTDAAVKVKGLASSAMIDEDNDKIIILDLISKREEIERQRNNEMKLLDKDVSSKFYRGSVSTKKVIFNIYKTEVGDDWLSISQKLYNDKRYWSQLQLWNEDLLTNIDIPEGQNIKYIQNIKNKLDK